MTTSYEARERCAYPSRDDCIRALAETSAEIQQRRWELITAIGPGEAARQVWAPWMNRSEEDLAASYASLLGRAGAA